MDAPALAAQAAGATREIAVQVAAIPGATQETIGSFQGPGGIVQENGGTSHGIAAAVERQRAATQEIAGSARRLRDLVFPFAQAAPAEATSRAGRGCRNSPRPGPNHGGRGRIR